MPDISSIQVNSTQYDITDSKLTDTVNYIVTNTLPLMINQIDQKQDTLSAGHGIQINGTEISLNTNSILLRIIDASTLPNGVLANIIGLSENELIILSNFTDGAEYSYTNVRGKTKLIVGNSDYDLMFRYAGNNKFQPLNFTIPLN